MIAAPLCTERITLRPLRRSDLLWLVELATDPDVRRTTLQPVIPRWLAKILALLEIRGGSPKLAIEDKRSGSPVGWIFLSRQPLAPAPYPSMGFEIRRKHWNRGYATEALQCLAEHLFRAEGLECLSGLAFVENEPSQRVFTKAGFENLGACVCNGHDCFLYQLSPAQLRKPIGETESLPT
jgi:RimJ/RimL family protein N-acetyltransferase